MAHVLRAGGLAPAADYVRARPTATAGRAITLSSRRIPAVLAIAAAVHILLYAASKLAVGCAHCAEIETYLHLDREANLPSWFSSSLWFLAGGAAAAIAVTAREMVWHWRGLVALCLFLSLDEASMFHETFGEMLGSAVSAGDVLHYNWLFYGIAAVLVVGAAFVPFLRALPRGTAIRIVLAGAIFVSGAIGAEFLGGASRAGAIDLIQGRALWGLQLMTEEFLEMLGIIMLIHALLHHLSRQSLPISLEVR